MPTTEQRRAVDAEIELVVEGRHRDPHRVLGRHDGLVRAFRPHATSMRMLVGGATGAPVTMMQVHPGGVFEAPISDTAPSYRFEAVYGEGDDGTTVVLDDPYRSWPTLSDLDLHLFGEGRHRRLWEVLGAHPRRHDGMDGVSFAVWAPNAQAVRVVGEWNFWDGRVHPMRSLGNSGVWELFIPGVSAGTRYKYELVAATGRVVLKADPMAQATQIPPDTASVVAPVSAYEWTDGPWLERRAQADPYRRPLSTYEVHLGSWLHTSDGEGGGRPLTYLELAEQLPAYVEEMGFTHVEFMPVAEHPFNGSWGYQVTGYYAPTSRFGSPDDFRELVDALHAKGIGVIVDWVPAHFPTDDFALARFDGTALYEHADPRVGFHPDWGTYVFNLGRNEVRNFLLANALYWVEQFHIDGLRVDAVASMLYLDYSRKAGEWIPNRFGGRENLESVEFLKEVNEILFANYPGATTLAEESTAWPGVSRPTYLGGLGFGYKWNMGWMHDTLEYFSTNPLFRSYHHDELTFGLVYAWSENFVLPLSHDEVVHGKKSMLNKMPGDRWQQMANLRALYGWMWAHPGKKLIFMGSEFAQEREWNHDADLDWGLLQVDQHRQMKDLVAQINKVYGEQPALWAQDTTGDGFRWIDASDSQSSIMSFMRLSGPEAPGEEGRPGVVACVANLTPVARTGYRVGLPQGGRWLELLNTDATEFGGTGMGNLGAVEASNESWHGQPYSALLTLPPLSVLWLAPG
jgi:1,4-alpha-glucan branching enzyme